MNFLKLPKKFSLDLDGTIFDTENDIYNWCWNIIKVKISKGNNAAIENVPFDIKVKLKTNIDVISIMSIA